MTSKNRINGPSYHARWTIKYRRKFLLVASSSHPCSLLSATSVISDDLRQSNNHRTYTVHVSPLSPWQKSRIQPQLSFAKLKPESSFVESKSGIRSPGVLHNLCQGPRLILKRTTLKISRQRGRGLNGRIWLKGKWKKLRRQLVFIGDLNARGKGTREAPRVSRHINRNIADQRRGRRGRKTAIDTGETARTMSSS